MSIHKTIIFNWKANPASLVEALDLVTVLNQKASVLAKNFNLAVAVPSPYLIPLLPLLDKNIRLMAQGINVPTTGPYTDSLPPQMLIQNGIGYTLLAHSEQRQKYSLDQDTISQLLKESLRIGLKVVFCIGEREKGENAFVNLKEQLDVLEPLLSQNVDHNWQPKLALAYEPIWSIGKSCTLDLNYIQNQAMHLKEYMTNLGLSTIDIFYGGSIDSQNIGDLLKLPSVAGVLIGERSSQKTWLEDLLQSMI